MTQAEEIIEMHEFGYTYIQIATLLGVEEKYVKEVIAKCQNTDI